MSDDDAKKEGASLVTEQSRVLTEAGFVHGFSTRRGGVSPAPFDSADFALLRDAGALRENQRRLAVAVGFDPARLYQASQVHGARVFVPPEEEPELGLPPRAGASSSDARYAEADALMGSVPGDTIGVRVADCVPVLVGDPRTGRVAAIHAGWKGVVAEVVAQALASLASPRAEDLVAAIGPCIGACCFEVSREVGEKIAAASARACVVSTPKPDKAMVDLRVAVAAQLTRAGLPAAHVEQVGGCTRCDVASYYSFRRDGERAGRLIAVITARAAR